jgi:hypothetical protein
MAVTASVARSKRAMFFMVLVPCAADVDDDRDSSNVSEWGAFTQS